MRQGSRLQGVHRGMAQILAGGKKAGLLAFLRVEGDKGLHAKQRVHAGIAHALESRPRPARFLGRLAPEHDHEQDDGGKRYGQHDAGDSVTGEHRHKQRQARAEKRREPRQAQAQVAFRRVQPLRSRLDERARLPTRRQTPRARKDCVQKRAAHILHAAARIAGGAGLLRACKRLRQGETDDEGRELCRHFDGGRACDKACHARGQRPCPAGDAGRAGKRQPYLERKRRPRTRLPQHPGARHARRDGAHYARLRITRRIRCRLSLPAHRLFPQPATATRYRTPAAPRTPATASAALLQRAHLAHAVFLAVGDAERIACLHKRQVAARGDGRHVDGRVALQLEVPARVAVRDNGLD